MKKSAYLVPAAIAVVCQLLVVSIAVIITLLQSQIMSLFFHYPSVYTKGNPVVPSGLITSMIMSLPYLIFLAVVFFYNGSHRRVIAGVFLGVTLVMLLLCSAGSTLYSMYFSSRHSILSSSMGSTVLSMKLSSMNSIFSFATILPNLFTASMYYISLGRFGMSDPE